VFCELVVEPLLGFVMLTLRAMPIATRVIDAVLLGTALARIAAVSVMSGSAVLDGADGLVV
jgi:hypothetical protein